MLEGLAARLSIKQEQIFDPHPHYFTFFSCSFSGAVVRLRYAPNMVSFQLKISINTDEIHSC